MEWIITLVTGAIGGNAAGMALKKYSLGTVGNSIAGLVGGGLGGQLLGGFLGGGAVDQVAAGGLGGIVTMLIAGVAKSMMAK